MDQLDLFREYRFRKRVGQHHELDLVERQRLSQKLMFMKSLVPYRAWMGKEVKPRIYSPLHTFVTTVDKYSTIETVTIHPGPASM